MEKNKKHSKNKAGVNAKRLQTQGSTSSVKSLGTKEAETILEMHVKGKVSPEAESPNRSKEDCEISTTVESGDQLFEKNPEQKGFQNSSGNNKLSQYIGSMEGRSFSSTKSNNKRWSEPWETRTECYDKRKSIGHIQNVDARERKNYRKSDSDSIPRGRLRDDRKLTEFETYKKELKRNPETTYVRTTEIDHDLFLMPKEYSLGHCVAEDMNMGSGIAVRFRVEFKRIGELLNQRARTGGLAVLEDGDRFIYYLVTKKLSTGKPTYGTLFASLCRMREHILKNDVKKLALPRIACGLDRLYWDNVKFMIEFIFKEVDVEIKICNLQDEDTPQLRHKNCRLTNVTYPVQDIEEGTIIVYLSSEVGFISDEMRTLDEKFRFLTEFRSSVKTKGDVIFFDKNENYLLCGCIVKNTETDLVDFISFQKCLGSIQKENRKYQFEFIAFQAIKDDDDYCFNYKIINILRNSLRDMEVYVCWPGDLQNDMMAQNRSSDYTPRTSSEQEKGRRSFNQSFSEVDSWRSLPSKSICHNKTCDPETEEQASTSILSERDCVEESDLSKSRSNENNSIKNPDNTTAKIDYCAEDKNLSNSDQIKLRSSPKKIKSCVQADAWDDVSFESSRQSAESRSSVLLPNDYEKYQMEKNIEVKTVHERKPWDLPKTYSRACYVTEDMNLESGVPFGSNFKNYIGECLSQNQKEGNIAVVRDGTDYLYCLVIKTSVTATPTHHSVFSAVQQMSNHAREHCVRNIVMPKMDEKREETFNWAEINPMLEFLCGRNNIQIILAPSEHVEQKNRLQHLKSGLHQMKKKSIIIYWASEDGYISPVMNSLYKKFEFVEEFTKTNKRLGNVIKYKQNEDHVLYGCIVKKVYTDPIDFRAVQQCLTKVNECNKTEKLTIVGIQAAKYQDETANLKIINILMNTLQNVTVNVCWPGDLRQKMPKI